MSRVILGTARLILREMTPEDIEVIAEMMAHPEVNFFYERRFNRDESEIWLKRQIERYVRDGTGLWLVLERATSLPVGQVGEPAYPQDVRGFVQENRVVGREPCARFHLGTDGVEPGILDRSGARNHDWNLTRAGPGPAPTRSRPGRPA